MPLWLYHQATSLLSWIQFNYMYICRSTVYCCGQSSGDLLIYYQYKKLLAAWSSVSGKWPLRSCTNITIKTAMRRPTSGKPHVVWKCTIMMVNYSTLPTWAECLANSLGKWNIIIRLLVPNTLNKVNGMMVCLEPKHTCCTIEWCCHFPSKYLVSRSAIIKLSTVPCEGQYGYFHN